jgi:hypothetical protein
VLQCCSVAVLHLEKNLTDSHDEPCCSVAVLQLAFYLANCTGVLSGTHIFLYLSLNFIREIKEYMYK